MGKIFRDSFDIEQDKRKEKEREERKIRKDLIKKTAGDMTKDLAQFVPCILFYEEGIINKKQFEKLLENYYKKVENGGKVADDIIRILGEKQK